MAAVITLARAERSLVAINGCAPPPPEGDGRPGPARATMQGAVIVLPRRTSAAPAMSLRSAPARAGEPGASARAGQHAAASTRLTAWPVGSRSARRRGELRMARMGGGHSVGLA